jgi:hypothetical protein
MAKQQVFGLMYRVGLAQTPAHIAQHVTGDPRRAGELIAANPHKPRAGLGAVPTFTTLHEGELLHMPPSWRARFPSLGLGATGKVLETGVDTLSDPILQAAVDVDNYLSAKGCDCTTSLIAITTKFQTAYNNGITAGTVQGTRLSTDGKYGPGTRAAIFSLLGHAPNACWGQGNPCSSLQGDIVIPKAAAKEDDLMGLVLEAGAEDLRDDGENWEVLTDTSVYEAVLEAVKKAGIEPVSSSVAMIPQNYIKLEGSQATTMIRLVEALEDNDDVQNVHANFDIDQKLLEEVAG